MEQLAELPPLAIITFGVTVAIIFGVRHLGLWQGAQPAAAAQVAAVIVDPTALNKATAALENHTEALKALTKACTEGAEYERRMGIEMERIREELRIHRELMRD
jgi:hypothetical protein